MRLGCLLLCCALSVSAAELPVKMAVNDKGLSALSVGGTDMLALGEFRLVKVLLKKADGTIAEGSKTASEAGPKGDAVSLALPWGTVSCAYVTKANRLHMFIAVFNTSQDTIHEIWLRPLSISMKGDGLKMPRPRTNIGSPSALALRHETGTLALCNEDLEKPLHLGFDRPHKGAVPVDVRAGGDRMLYDELYMRRPIPPGKQDSYHISLRFGPADGDPHDLADDIYQRYAALHPPLLDWPDRRPILRLFLSGGLPAETVLDYYRRGEKGPLPPGDPAYAKAVLAKLRHGIEAAVKVNAQGIIIWDMEGDVFPHATTYIGDPRLTKILNPAMDAIADEYYAAIRKAGLRAGLCIRPSHMVYAKDKDTMMQSFGTAKDPFLELDAKIEYCKKRWQISIFYIDTNTFWRPRGKDGKWTSGLIDADVWRRLCIKHPKALLIPEHNYVQYWAYTAPYNELDCGYRGIPAWVRRVYPKAFCVPVIEDADAHASHDMLVRMVRDGDCPMTFIYGMSRNAAAIPRIYAEAKLLDQGEPDSVAQADLAALAKLVASGDPRTRFHAARRLAAHDKPEAVKALLGRVADPEEDWLVRKEAIVALGKLRAVEAVDGIGTFLKVKKPDLKFFAVKALAEISKVVTPTGIGKQTDDLDLDGLE